MAVVLWIRLVRGSTSFFPRRGSRGVRAPNCYEKERENDIISRCGLFKATPTSLMILMSIQLLEDVVMSLKKVGAKER